MKKMEEQLPKLSERGMFGLALSLMLVLGTSAGVRADEADAKKLLKGMSDYLSAQKSLSFAYDATLDVVTKDDTIIHARDDFERGA